jgi:ATP-dependent DNA ligase
MRHADPVEVPDVAPMLAGSGIPPWLAEPAWVEPKLDGFRARLIVDRRLEGNWLLKSRNGRALAAPGLVGVGRERPTMVLDGELVSGAGTTGDVYSMYSRAEGLTFAAFDLVWLDGSPTARSYERRRAELEALAFAGPGWVHRAEMGGRGRRRGVSGLRPPRARRHGGEAGTQRLPAGRAVE